MSNLPIFTNVNMTCVLTDFYGNKLHITKSRELEEVFISKTFSNALIVTSQNDKGPLSNTKVNDIFSFRLLLKHVVNNENAA